LLIASLYDTESSYTENAVTIATFLQVQLLKTQNASLPEIADPEAEETIRSYWEYEDHELLAEWHSHTGIASASVIRYQLDYWGDDPIWRTD
jgi:hypothetical protein